MAGLSATGFDIETLQQILDDIESYQRTNINAQLNQTATSVVGQLNGIFGAKLRELWELAEAVYAAFYPDSATGVALDNVCSLTGVIRLPALKASGTVTINTDAAFSANAGDLVCYPTSNPDWLFENTAAFGPVGPGNTNVNFEAQISGDKFVAASSTWEISATVAGWNTVGPNAADIDNGRDVETDAELRIRRSAELDAQGKATLESIRSDLLQVDAVTDVTVLENVADVVVDGMEPHSVRAIVLGGTETGVAEGLFETKAAGIETNGAVSKTVADTQGINHTIKFDRPTEKDIEMEITLTAIEDDYGGDAAIKTALVALGSTLQIGNDVIASKFRSEAFEVSGVIDVTYLQLNVAAGPTGTTNLIMDTDELAAFDSADITVNSNLVDAAP